MAAVIDLTEVRRLAADFGHAGDDAILEIDKVVERGALGMKKTMAEDAANSGHYKLFAASISYDRRYGFGSIAYDVGPDKDRPQGALGNILYFGTSNNDPELDIEVGMRSEGPPLERNLADVAERLASRRG